MRDQHLSVVHPEQLRHECMACNQVLETPKALLQHLEVVHEQVEKILSNDPKDSGEDLDSNLDLETFKAGILA